MKLSLLFVLAASWSLAPVVRAEEAPPAPEHATNADWVTLVVESEPAATVKRLRAELTRQVGVPIAGLSEMLGDESRAPRVLLTVSRSAPEAGPSAREPRESVSVVYWDSSGRVDALSAALPAAEGGFELVASTLGSALLRRNLPRLRAERGEAADCPSCEFRRLVADLRAQAMTLVPVRRRTFPISLEDF